MLAAIVLSAVSLPVAEAETWLGDTDGWIWIPYVMPVFIVILGTVLSARAARRHRREAGEGEPRR